MAKSAWVIEHQSARYDCPCKPCKTTTWFELDGRKPIAHCCKNAKRCDLKLSELEKPTLATAAAEHESHSRFEVVADDGWTSIVRMP